MFEDYKQKMKIKYQISNNHKSNTKLHRQIRIANLMYEISSMNYPNLVKNGQKIQRQILNYQIPQLYKSLPPQLSIFGVHPKYVSPSTQPRSHFQMQKYLEQVHQLHQLINTQFEPIAKEINPSLKDLLVEDKNIQKEKKAVYLYCFYNADIYKVAEDMKSTPSQICKALNPVIITAIRLLENIINKRNLRKMAVRWSYQQLKDFKHHFFEVKNGRLFGTSVRVNLKIFYKLLKITYESPDAYPITNQEALSLYQALLDLHLKHFLDFSKKNKYKRQEIHYWNRDQLKFFCQMIKRTDNFEAIHNLMMKQYSSDKNENAPIKYAIDKLYIKLESILKGTFQKIKHQCLLYPSLGRLSKMQSNDFGRLCYIGHEGVVTLRRQMIQYFLSNAPPILQTYRLIERLNIFTSQSKLFDQNVKLQNAVQHDETQQNKVHRQNIRQALRDPKFIRPMEEDASYASCIKKPKGQPSSVFERLKIKDQTIYQRKVGTNLSDMQRKLKEIQVIKKHRVADQMQIYDKNLDSDSQQQDFGKYDNNEREVINPFLKQVQKMVGKDSEESVRPARQTEAELYLSGINQDIGFMKQFVRNDEQGNKLTGIQHGQPDPRADPTLDPRQRFQIPNYLATQYRNPFGNNGFGHLTQSNGWSQKTIDSKNQTKGVDLSLSKIQDFIEQEIDDHIVQE